MRLIPTSESSVRDVVGTFTIRIDGDMLVALAEKKLYVVSTAGYRYCTVLMLEP